MASALEFCKIWLHNSSTFDFISIEISNAYKQHYYSFFLVRHSIRGHKNRIRIQFSWFASSIFFNVGKAHKNNKVKLKIIVMESRKRYFQSSETNMSESLGVLWFLNHNLFSSWVKLVLMLVEHIFCSTYGYSARYFSW